MLLEKELSDKTIMLRKIEIFYRKNIEEQLKLKLYAKHQLGKEYNISTHIITFLLNMYEFQETQGYNEIELLQIYCDAKQQFYRT